LENNPLMLRVSLTGGFLRGFARFVFIAVLLTTGSASAQSFRLWLQGGESSLIGDITRLYASPGDAATVNFDSTGGMAIFTNPSTGWWLGLHPPDGQLLAAGAYEDTSTAPPSTQASLYFTFGGTSCYGPGRRFYIHEVTYSAGHIASLAVDFEYSCGGVVGLATYGEFRFNSSVPLTIEKPAGSGAVNGFGFTPGTHAPASSLVVSNSVTAYGINVDVPISIMGGEYSIDYRPFTSLPGVVRSRDHVRVRTTSAAGAGASTSAMLTMGSSSATFTVTTYDPAVPYTAHWYESSGADLVGQGQSGYFVAPRTPFEVTSPDAMHVNVYVYTPFGPNILKLDSGTTPLALGAYEVPTPGSDFAVQWRACPAASVSMRFVVRDIAWVSGVLARLAVDFEQQCSEGRLFGEIRYNTTVPLGILATPGDTTPDAFAFRPVFEVPPSAAIFSEPTTVYDVNAPTTISVVNGQYSVNGAAFTSAPGTVVNRDRVRVRTISASTPLTASSATLTIGGVSAAFTATTFTPVQPLNAFFFDSSPGDGMYNGQSTYGKAPEWTISAAANEDDYHMVRVVLSDTRGYQMHINFGSGSWLPLAAGAYEDVMWSQYSASPTMFISQNGATPIGCERPTGRFVVLEADITGTTVNHLAIDFEAWCPGGSVPIYGELRFNSTVPLSFMVPGADSTPDAFAFSAESPVRPGAVVVAGPVRLYGANTGIPLSITGGEYSLNGGPFTSAPTTAQELDRVSVRVTASSTPGTVNQAMLNAGGQTGALTVTSYQAGMALTGVYYKSTIANDPGGGRTRLYLTPRNFMYTGPAGSDGQLTFLVRAVFGDFVQATLVGPDRSRIVSGTYEDVRGYLNPVAGRAGLMVSTGTGACDGIGSRLVVHEAIFNPDGTPQRFAADYSLRCGMPGAPMIGEIRYNSQVPFSALADPAAATRRAGDLDGDGKSDIVIRDSSTGMNYGWLMNGLSIVNGAYLLSADSGWSIAAFADLNGDGKADVLIQHTDGSLYAWIMNGLTVTTGGYVLGAGTGFSLSHVGDFNGDGKADLIFKHTNGSTYVQLMNGVTALNGTFLQGAGSGWSVSHVADFDGDGKSDILLKHTDGSAYVNLMNGITVANGTFLIGAGGGWSATATGDFNGDGKADILITHTNGGVYLWQMNGTTITTGAYLLSPTSGWSITKTGDLDGDGKTDIVIKHTDGSHYAWIMNGLSVSTGGYLLGAGTGWSVSYMLDLNGDGKSDILLKHTDGSIYAWLMNGATIANGAYLMGAGTWQVAP
jgi:hypothetical protein